MGLALTLEFVSLVVLSLKHIDGSKITVVTGWASGRVNLGRPEFSLICIETVSPS